MNLVPLEEDYCSPDSIMLSQNVLNGNVYCAWNTPRSADIYNANLVY